MPDLEPITRDEMLWSGEDLEPITRREMYIKHLYDETQVIPEKPITREEMFILKAGEELHDVTIEQLTATENRTYSEEGVAYSPVIVNVPQTTLTTLDVTENGTYTAPSGTAYNEVEVDVPLPDNAYLLKDIANTPASIATFTDGSALPMPKLEVAVEPQQDLHGYDAPWVGGAGRNKFDFTNITVTSSRTIASDVSLKAGDYTVAFDIKNNSNIEGYYLIRVGSTSLGGANFGANYSGRLSKSFSLSEDSIINIYVAGASSGYSYEFSKGQIESGSIATSFAPYSNICPISGWSAVDVTRCGKNLVESTLANTTINNIGEINASGGSTTFDMHIAKIIKGETYTIQSDESQNVNQKFVGGFFYDMPQLDSISYNNARLANTPATFTAPIDGYVAFRTSHNYAFAQIEIGSTATTYEPYNGNTYSLTFTDGSNPLTVYEGTVDLVSGVLTLTHGYVDLGTLDWQYSSISERFYVGASDLGVKATDASTPFNAISSALIAKSYNEIEAKTVDYAIAINPNATQLFARYSSITSASDFITAMNGVQLVYELATPTTIQLTPTQVSSLMGVNNIWADCGQILEGEYWSKEV